MVVIRPFRGCLLIDPETGTSDRCAAPPYDVLDSSERDRFAALSPANVVHLTLPAEPQDGSGTDRYAAARALLEQMSGDGRLVRDADPCFYLQDVQFESSDGTPITRRGLLAAITIEPIGTAGIRGHEEVMPKPLADRTALLAATETNLEPLYFLYSDPEGKIDAALEPSRNQEPLSSSEFQGLRFDFRRVATEAGEAVAELFRNKPLYIADGHHRFTVADRFHDQRPELAGSGFRLALLVRAEDPGVVALPTHRFVTDLDDAAADALFERLRDGFDLEPCEGEEILARLAARNNPAAFGVWLRGRQPACVATPKAATLAALDSIPEPLRSLDVSVLHRHLLEPDALGHALECRYVRGEDDPIGLAVAQDVPLAFFMQAPAIETVLAVSDKALTMPPKSTYFFPKAASGQVLMRLDEAP